MIRRTITTGMATKASVEMRKPSSIASCSGRCEKEEIASSEKRSIFGQRVLGLAGVAGVAAVGHRGLAVADPDGHAAQEAVALAHRQQRVERPAVEQAEVARVVLELDLGELVEQGVEPPRGGQLEARLALAVLAHGVDDVDSRRASDRASAGSARAGPAGRSRASPRRRRGRGRAPRSGRSGGRSCATGRRRARADPGGELVEQDRRAVARAVVDEHDLEREPSSAAQTRA